MKLMVGRIEKVNYSNVCDMMVLSVRMRNESVRLKDVVRDIGKYMNKNLDAERVRRMLVKHGNIVERRELQGEVLSVEEWVIA